MIEYAIDLKKAFNEKDKELFESHLDPKHALRFLVADLSTGNFDGPQIFQCSKKKEIKSIFDCYTQNFYQYESTSKKFFTIIPWDYDWTFYRGEWYLNLPEWNDLSYDCTKHYVRSSIQDVWPAVCHPYYRMLAEHYKHEYADALSELLDGPLSGTNLQEKIDQWIQQITPHVEEDTLYKKEEWLEAVQSLRTNVDFYIALMTTRLEKARLALK
jgi:hypothetical protein